VIVGKSTNFKSLLLQSTQNKGSWFGFETEASAHDVLANCKSKLQNVKLRTLVLFVQEADPDPRDMSSTQHKTLDLFAIEMAHPSINIHCGAWLCETKPESLCSVHEKNRPRQISCMI